MRGGKGRGKKGRGDKNRTVIVRHCEHNSMD